MEKIVPDDNYASLIISDESEVYFKLFIMVLCTSQNFPLATPTVASPGSTHLHSAGVVSAIQQRDLALHGV